MANRATKRFHCRELSPSSRSAPGPLFDVGAEPEKAAAGAHVDDRGGEVGVAIAEDGDGTPAGYAEDPGDGVRIDEVVGISYWQPRLFSVNDVTIV